MSRWGALVAVVAVASVATLGPRAHDAVTTLTVVPFPEALVALAGLLQLALSLVVLLILAAAPVPALRALTPRFLRVLLLTGAGGVLLVAPAGADESTSGDHRLDGLRLPDRPVASAPPLDLPAATPAPAPAPDTAGDLVVVRPGDTLWAIARHALPEGATSAEVARAWPRWYAANRDVIGDDPDLILPSQRLRPPGKDHP